MGNTDGSIPAKRPCTGANGYSVLPELDTRHTRDAEGKQVQTAGDKEVVSRNIGGLEVWPTHGKQHLEESGIEAIGTEDKEAVQTSAYVGDGANFQATDRHKTGESGAQGRRRGIRWILVAAIVLVTIGVALGVGLGISLQSHSQNVDDSQPTSPDTNATESSLAPTLSTHGAFNGSGITMRRQPDLLNLTSGESGTSNDDPRNLLLAFQHHSGDIRWMQRAWPNTWQGGSESESITNLAKNGTSLSILITVTSAEAKAEWHLFYVGEDNKLHQQTIDNHTYTWHAGLLDDLSIPALDADKCGLVTCYYNGPIDDPSYNASSDDSGIRLWIATSATTFQQISWQGGMPSWVIEQQWTGLNGHAQPACNGWSSGTVTYAMFVDQDDQVAFYWRDHGDQDDDDPDHPMDAWVKATLNIPAVDPEAGLSYGFGGNLFARTSNNGPVLGWNVTFEAEKTSISGGLLSQVSGDPAVSGSALASWSITPDVGGIGEYEMLVFYQTEGDDITVFSGDGDSGNWSSVKLPIPDE